MIVESESDVDSNDKTHVVTCSEGLFATGGGAELLGETAGVAIVATRPAGLPGEIPRGWVAGAAEINDRAGDWYIRVHAVCAKVN